MNYLFSVEYKLTSAVQFSSVAHSCPTLCNPMNRNTPGLPVHHQLPESTQTHVHRVGDAIQPSHSLSSPSPPALNLCPGDNKILHDREIAVYRENLYHVLLCSYPPF